MRVRELEVSAGMVEEIEEELKGTRRVKQEIREVKAGKGVAKRNGGKRGGTEI